MNAPPSCRQIRGRFLLWEPDPKSRSGHRLLDSDRPTTSFAKPGGLFLSGDLIELEQSRYIVRGLILTALTPVWGGLALGLCLLLGLLPGQLIDQHAGLCLLLTAAIAFLSFRILVRRFVPPIRRRFFRAQVTNVQQKQIKFYQNHILSKGGPLGVDFTILPKDLPTMAVAEQCSFVTFVAESREAAAFLAKNLPITQAPLAGKRNVDIPAQQHVRSAMAEPEPASHQSRPAGLQRYPHDMKLGQLLGPAGLFGVGAACAIHYALTNNRGLIIDQIIRLGPTGATIFYWLMSACSGGLTLALAAKILQRIVNPHFLTVGPEGIAFGGGWLKSKMNLVTFTAIQGTTQQQKISGGPRTLILKVHSKPVCIRENFLKNSAAYEEILAAISQPRR